MGSTQGGSLLGIQLGVSRVLDNRVVGNQGSRVVGNRDIQVAGNRVDKCSVAGSRVVGNQDNRVVGSQAVEIQGRAVDIRVVDSQVDILGVNHLSWLERNLGDLGPSQRDMRLEANSLEPYKHSQHRTGHNQALQESRRHYHFFRKLLR